MSQSEACPVNLDRPSRRTYHLLDIDVVVHGPPWALAMADGWLGHVASTDSGLDGGHVVDVWIVGTTDRCWLRLDDDEETPPVSAASLPPLLRWVVQRALRDRTSGLVLHAAVLGRDGAAMLLVGDTGAGKSTFSAALSGSGWTALGDDIAVVDVDGRVRAARTPAALPLAATAALRESGLPVEQPPPAAHEPMVVRWVVAPGHDDGCRAAVRALGPGEVTMALLRSAGRADVRALALAQAVATGARAWQVTVPDPRGAVTEISRLVRGTSTRVRNDPAMRPNASTISVLAPAGPRG